MPGLLKIMGQRGGQAQEELFTKRLSLTGWDAIEDHMRRHDDGMVKDLADDIDTMLVFAGLFSAALTAFLAQTYQTLQPDNSQLTVNLLTGISTQLGSFTISDRFVNASTTVYNSTTTSSSSFQVASSAIAINTLWFLSLIFSLGAALFGLLVKQWLREYMKWNHVLAPPRENVLIRQVRLEAWEHWKVSAIISAIPALLEIGVILFFSGMIVFLWTLERTVAIIVTTAIAFFLAITVVFTLLPVVSRHCPYKTPTGWAFAYLYQSLRQFSKHLIATCIAWVHSKVHTESDSHSHLDSSDSGTSSSSHPRPTLHAPQGWRDRDQHLLESDSRSRTINWLPEDDLPEEFDHHAACLHDYEFNTLNRAFAWVLRGSESDQLRQNVFQCLQSVYRSKGHDIREGIVRHFHMMYILHQHPAWSLLDGSAELYHNMSADDWVTYRIGSYMLTNVRDWQYFLHGQTLYSVVRSGTSEAQEQILFRLALCELRFQFELWELRLQQYETYSNSMQHKEGLRDTTKGIVQMIVAFFRLRAAVFTDTILHRDLLATATGTLVEVFNRVAIYDIAHRTGVTAMILGILCMSADIEFDSNGVLIAESVHFRRRVDNFSTLRSAVYLAEYHYQRRNEPFCCHMFILLSHFSLCVVEWFIWEDSAIETGDIIASLLTWMQEHAEWSMLSGDKNCAGWVDLPWIGTIVTILEFEANQYDEDRVLSHSNKMQLVQLLSTLERSSDMGLLTGESIQADLARCFDMLDLHTDDSGQLPPGWQWRIDDAGVIYYVHSAWGHEYQMTRPQLPPSTPESAGSIFNSSDSFRQVRKPRVHFHLPRVRVTVGDGPRTTGSITRTVRKSDDSLDVSPYPEQGDLPPSKHNHESLDCPSDDSRTSEYLDLEEWGSLDVEETVAGEGDRIGCDTDSSEVQQSCAVLAITGMTDESGGTNVSRPSDEDSNGGSEYATDTQPPGQECTDT